MQNDQPSEIGPTVPQLLLVSVFLLLVVWAIFAWLRDAETQPAVATDGAPAELPHRASASAAQAALAELRTEPDIIEVLYDPQMVVQWTIGMRDDGSSRRGFAEYVCLVLGEHGAVDASTSVRVVDYNDAMSNGGDFRAASLGHVGCKSGLDLGV